MPLDLEDKNSPLNNMGRATVLWIFISVLIVLCGTKTFLDDNYHEIKWNHFVKSFLAQGIVEGLEVINNEYAVVVFTPGSHADVNVNKRFKYWFGIGTPEILEKKLDLAQDKLMGYAIQGPVNVTYALKRNYIGFYVVIAVILALPVIADTKIVAYFWKLLVSQWSKLQKDAKPPAVRETLYLSFREIVGCEDSKSQIMILMQYMKNPGLCRRLGAKPPKAVLLYGPPGVGKASLAQATANEANVSFFTINGLECDAQVGGIGPAEVRNTFQLARFNAPCILFIDEIDAIGRVKNPKNEYDDTQTLKQLLIEMDYCQNSVEKDILIIGATCGLELVDKSLMHPGRFYKCIKMSSPDFLARSSIFRMQLKRLAISSEKVNDLSNKMATKTSGFTGAQIQNICNEAALVAVRNAQNELTPENFDQALVRFSADVLGIGNRPGSPRYIDRSGEELGDASGDETSSIKSIQKYSCVKTNL